MLGELVQTTAGKWIIHPPARCPNGHEFGPGRALMGYQACLGHGGGHTTWTCRTCDETVYGPPLNTHCKTLNGPGNSADLDCTRLTAKRSPRPRPTEKGRVIDDPTRRRMITHLEHEVAQFLGALAEFTAVDGRGVLDLDRADTVRIRRTAFFEIVLLHARLLDDFLGTEPTKPDDFWARHFIDDWEATSPLDGLPPPSPGGLTVRPVHQQAVGSRSDGVRAATQQSLQCA